MDTIADPDITFDDQGICNYYYQYQEKSKKLPSNAAESDRQLAKLAEQMKQKGRGKPYDCVIGVSGGVDSSYVALLAYELGLRPLAVHFDNGWNTPIAEANIHHLVSELGLDLQLFEIDQQEFYDFQRSFMKSSVTDIEMVTDHAIIAGLYKVATENDISFILSGTNIQTETTMPPTWNFNKRDYRNIRAIHEAFGTIAMKTYPLMDKRFRRTYIEKTRIQSVSILNYVPFVKKDIKEKIKKQLHWQEYGFKHGESVFTRFYQNYILPEKYRIDKRKAHLSDLIFANQMTKEEALQQLKEPLYDPQVFASDYAMVLEKLQLSEREFKEIMQQPPHSHQDFDYVMPIERRYPILKPVKWAWNGFKVKV